MYVGVSIHVTSVHKTAMVRTLGLAQLGVRKSALEFYHNNHERYESDTAAIPQVASTFANDLYTQEQVPCSRCACQYVWHSPYRVRRSLIIEECSDDGLGIR